MDLKVLRIAAATAFLAAHAFGAEPSVVLVQGRAVRHSPRMMSWSLCENGVFSGPREGETYRVPPGRTLVITEASFTLHGGGARSARSALLSLILKQGPASFNLGGVTGHLESHLATKVLSKRFSPGLVVPGGAEVRGELTELESGGGSVAMDLNLYGYLR
ncbi:hypothetical protein [Mesoterricola silvestris]|uniref:DUF4402 domain-containing protein n=1 Tax=Mesoterricola silvestris TaxID=2927979 RepID=A0AA48GY53_9BACT|nr:hypothetical protein [Mesoterricola silvestris]BDU74026.1 hypothetical protein METEAL_32000 [Mesoterricola silvestris]